MACPRSTRTFLDRVWQKAETTVFTGRRDDWISYTDYRGYEKTDQVIEWFWQCIRSWPTERKARLLQFATGTSRVPVNGFKDLQGSDGPRRFTIDKSGDPSQLPRSHTCFNRIELPPYEDYESLERKLTYAIEYVEFRCSRRIVYSFYQGNGRFRSRVTDYISFLYAVFIVYVLRPCIYIVLTLQCALAIHFVYTSTRTVRSLGADVIKPTRATNV